VPDAGGGPVEEATGGPLEEVDGCAGGSCVNVENDGTVAGTHEEQQIVDNAAVGELTIDDIRDALIMATQDSSKSATVTLHGINIRFDFLNNPVKYTNRKMFTRVDGITKLLYWWYVFGAMIVNGKLLLTPCVVQLNDGRNVLVECILETMCFRPRYDGLCIDLDTNVVSVERNIGARVKKYLLDATYDRSLTDRCFKLIRSIILCCFNFRFLHYFFRLADEYLVKERWYYDPSRLLPRSCKDPQKPDTVLKKSVPPEEKPVPPEETPPKAAKTNGNKRKPTVVKKPAPKKKKLLPDPDISSSSDSDSSVELVKPTPRSTTSARLKREDQKVDYERQPSLCPPLAPEPIASVPVLPVPPVVLPMQAATPIPAVPSSMQPSLAIGGGAMPPIHAISNVTPMPFNPSPMHMMPPASSAMYAELLYENMRYRIEVEQLTRRENERKEAEQRVRFIRAFNAQMGFPHGEH